MKIKPNLKTFIYLVVIALSLGALALVATSNSQFTDTKVVYQGF
ncbi:hypothetical protein [Pedosphaera parvula]|uniref:Uncharacterized protein n=1 Tax=Pedosphaera parvula (strain Ellin514) TaxID=320771 RepID=B9XSL1_PEDPL|nr:hypothetical protein [Pedosphaera parvula]EEF57171.1 hypothetical protein Cflav_PD0137 [Pedosphaera parvula Ellin514]